MDPTQWAAVDSYLATALIPTDEALAATLHANTAAGLPAIDVSPLQGRFLHVLVKIQGARRILEIGALGGYSTICMARALPADGRLTSLELDPRHVDVARRNIARAGLDGKVTVIQGAASESLARLQAEGGTPFDFIFIDADKPSTSIYFKAALSLSKAGTVIVVDNVVRRGTVVDTETTDENVRGMRRFLDAISGEARVEASAVQTVGIKGHDGFVLARVVS